MDFVSVVTYPDEVEVCVPKDWSIGKLLEKVTEKYPVSWELRDNSLCPCTQREGHVHYFLIRSALRREAP